MLVLSRKIGETIVIDGNIEVKVLAVQGNKVRLGVVAPPSVTVDRQEIHDRRATFTEVEPILRTVPDTVLNN